jgi:hypothetical protein
METPDPARANFRKSDIRTISRHVGGPQPVIDEDNLDEDKLDLHPGVCGVRGAAGNRRGYTAIDMAWASLPARSPTPTERKPTCAGTGAQIMTYLLHHPKGLTRPYRIVGFEMRGIMRSLSKGPLCSRPARCRNAL